MSGITLDAGPLIQLDRNKREVVALLAHARATNHHVIVPASALAQAMRDPARQTRLSRLLRQPRTHVIALDRVDATSVGRILAASKTRDIADAHVVLCARRTGTTIVTSDPDDLLHLDPDARVVAV